MIDSSLMYNRYIRVLKIKPTHLRQRCQQKLTDTTYHQYSVASFLLHLATKSNRPTVNPPVLVKA